MDFISLGLMAIGLSMDAFAVAICNGIAAKRVAVGQALTFGAVFGGFQFAMPVAGYYLGSAFNASIESADHWIAFALLAFVGGKMIFETLRAKRAAAEKTETAAGGTETGEAEAAADGTRDASGGKPISFAKLLALGVATSIDALAVGVSIAITGWNVWISAAVIGATAFTLSFAGVFAGKKLGGRFQKNAGLLGGIVLIGMGIKILIEHLL